ncbi:MAG: tRNA adenosine(34) deaminase TadA [Gammaproteobacteria bacterium]|nr:tRNA adenosine(34) deaminase TadA [Gammaproteobacteria bacterium]
MSHASWMRAALEEAARAESLGEVPVGAVVVIGEQVVGRGCNQSISSHDPTAHAEIVALRDAAARLGNYRLPGATLYVTVEPCTMCAGALIHARVERVVFGAAEPRSGALTSTAQVLDNAALNHRVDVVGGVLEEQCAERLKRFFANRR